MGGEVHRPGTEEGVGQAHSHPPSSPPVPGGGGGGGLGGGGRWGVVDHLMCVGRMYESVRRRQPVWSRSSLLSILGHAVEELHNVESTHFGMDFGVLLCFIICCDFQFLSLCHLAIISDFIFVCFSSPPPS